MARLEIFGDLTLYNDRDERVPLGSRGAWLLAVLAIERTPQLRHRLARWLWPDRGPEQARASLRQCLVELRHTFTRFDVKWPLIVTAKELTWAQGKLTVDAVADPPPGIDAKTLTEVLCRARGRTPFGSLEGDGELQRWALAARLRIEISISDSIAAVLAASPAKVAIELARTRKLYTPDCPHAVDYLRHRLARAPVLNRTLTPLPLPPDAPPAILIEPFGLGGLHPAEAALALAIREEIIVALARFREVRIIDWTAAAPERQIDAGYRLAVTLRSGSDGPVAMARLTATATQDVLWGHRAVLDDVNLQSAIEKMIEQIVSAITPAVQAHLLGDSAGRPAGVLYTRYLNARFRAQRPADHAAALALAGELEAIVTDAPTFAPPMLSLARLYNTDFAWTRAMSSSDAHRERAFALARQAVAVDSGQAHGYSLLGWCHLRRSEWAAARRFFDEAVRLNPHHVERLMEVAYGKLHLGDLDGAETLLRRCLSMTPASSDGFHFDLAMLSLVRGDPLLAVEHLLMIADPDPWARIARALATVQAGRPVAEARAGVTSEIAKLWPGGVLPEYPALQTWVETRHPFRSMLHRDRFMKGLDVVFG